MALRSHDGNFNSTWTFEGPSPDSTAAATAIIAYSCYTVGTPITSSSVFHPCQKTPGLRDHACPKPARPARTKTQRQF